MTELVIALKTDLVVPKFYTFTQNNSGGSFTLDEADGITHFVIVEAHSADEANSKAIGLGLYFDGSGDCPCCGDRWSEQWDDSDGHPTPQIYGEDAEAYVTSFKWMPPGKEIVIHRLDGTVRWHGVFEKTRK